MHDSSLWGNVEEGGSNEVAFVLGALLQVETKLKQLKWNPKNAFKLTARELANFLYRGRIYSKEVAFF